MRTEILLVEDEADLALIVADTLRGEGYGVEIAADGAAGLERFGRGGIDIIVADVMMPRMDGLAMVRKIRRQSSTVPILLLTAKSTVDDVERGFDSGADDYLRKPFELRELLIRIRALLRRIKPVATAGRYAIGRYIFDGATQTLSIDGSATVLSHFEARILCELASRPGCTVDAAELAAAVWGCDDLYKRNSLHGYVHRLRAALAADSSVAIINRRGYGYMLVTGMPVADDQAPR